MCVVKNLDLHLHVSTKVGDATLKSHQKINMCSPELGPFICFSIERLQHADVYPHWVKGSTSDTTPETDESSLLQV